MAFRLSTGFRDLQLGFAASGHHAWANQVLLGDNVTVADVSASWTVTGGTSTIVGNVTDPWDSTTGNLKLTSVGSPGVIEQEITVIPQHTYRLTFKFGTDSSVTDTIKPDIGTTSGDDDIYSGTAITLAAADAWYTYGNSNVTMYNDDAFDNDGAIVFTAGAGVTSVFLRFTASGTTDDFYFDEVRLVDQSRSLQSIFLGGTIKIYSGTQPTNPSDAPTGTLLVTIDNASGDLVWNNATAGSISKPTGDTWEGTCGSTGTAGWARLVTATDSGVLSTTDPRCDMAVGTSGAQINFSSTAFTSGATQTITSLTISIPQG